MGLSPTVPLPGDAPHIVDYRRTATKRSNLALFVAFLVGLFSVVVPVALGASPASATTSWAWVCTDENLTVVVCNSAIEQAHVRSTGVVSAIDSGPYWAPAGTTSLTDYGGGFVTANFVYPDSHCMVWDVGGWYTEGLDADCAGAGAKPDPLPGSGIFAVCPDTGTAYCAEFVNNLGATAYTPSAFASFIGSGSSPTVSFVFSSLPSSLNVVAVAGVGIGIGAVLLALFTGWRFARRFVRG